MTIASYNLEDEERCLKSYLQKTTAITTKRQDCDFGRSNSPDDTNKNNENENETDDDDDESIGKRVLCCKTSRSLYCPICCRVLVPKRHWPKRFILRQNKSDDGQRHNGSPFPFQFMDIVLGIKERRTSSTGIQLVCISNMIAEASESSRGNVTNSQEQRRRRSESTGSKSTSEKAPSAGNDDSADCHSTDANNDTNGNEWWKNIKLYDLNKEETLPDYSASQNSGRIVNEDKVDGDATGNIDEGGTYVLFPQEGKSVPMSSVAGKIKRLVVLDIKWTRSFNVKLFSADYHKIMVSSQSEAGGGKSYNPLSGLKDLPFVHLEFPPQNSNFWRWHNRGEGMLSTIEAIYFAAREASVALQQRRDIGENEKGDDNARQIASEEQDNDQTFTDILWLFALQRSIIQERSVQEGRPVAFSEEAKAMARALRKQHSPPNAS